jgi:hypothetical protein
MDLIIVICFASLRTCGAPFGPRSDRDEQPFMPGPSLPGLINVRALWMPHAQINPTARLLSIPSRKFVMIAKSALQTVFTRSPKGDMRARRQRD